MTTYYEVEQKIIPFAYPQVHLFTSATMVYDGEKSEDTIYLKRDIADWASITPESIGPTIAYTLGLCKTIENNAWDGEDSDTIDGELWAYIRFVDKQGDTNVGLYFLEFALCKDPMDARRIRDEIEAELSTHGIKSTLWVFKYGDGLKKPILDMLYDKHGYYIDISDKITNTVSFEEFPECDIYTCVVSDMLKNEEDSSNETEEVQA